MGLLLSFCWIGVKSLAIAYGVHTQMASLVLRISISSALASWMRVKLLHQQPQYESLGEHGTMNESE